MGKQPKISTDDVIAEIEDTLPELTVLNVKFGRLTTIKGSLLVGYYIQYQISPWDIYRAVYLGNGDKPTEMKRNFDAWAKNWRV